MEFKFVNYKSELSYVTLLPKITFKYCDNFDGRIYATFTVDEQNDDNDIVGVLIDQLRPIVNNKKNSVILNLLVNPFFNDLCDYLLRNPGIAVGKIKFIKKHIFSYLGDEYVKKMYGDLSVEGADIYIKHNMYEKSKQMMILL